MRIYPKLILAFFFMAFLVGVVGYFGLRASVSVSQSYSDIGENFQEEVSGAILAGNLVKKAEGKLLLYLALGIPDDKENFFKYYQLFLQQIEGLEVSVTTSGGLKKVADLNKVAAEILIYAKKLINLYSTSTPATFELKQHEMLTRHFHDLTSKARRINVEIAKRSTLDAAVEVSSYAKRASGHMMLFLQFGKEIDKEKFFLRHISLIEQIEILDSVVFNSKILHSLDELKGAAKDIKTLGNQLLSAYEIAPESFYLKSYETLIRHFFHAVDLVSEKGIEIGQEEARLGRYTSVEANRFSQSIQNQIFAVIIVAIGFALIVGFIIARSIAIPIKKLTDHVKEVGNTGNFSSALTLSQKDEVGELATEFQKMTLSLTSVRNKLLEQSYYSGMSEIATGILHNVTNFFTPLVVSFDMIEEHLRKIELDKLNKVVAADNLQNLTSERLHDLQKYQKLYIKLVNSEIDEVAKNVSEIQVQLSVISNILLEHEKFVYAERPIEIFNLQKLFEEAVSTTIGRKGNKFVFSISPRIKELGDIESQKIVFLQVVVNIIQNALRSVAEYNPSSAKIRISGEVEKDNGREYIHLQIADNGIGISQKNIERIFKIDYSTKKKYSSGFGLHWCANSINALKGKIFAESEGLGRGACLHIIIPRKFI